MTENPQQRPESRGPNAAAPADLPTQYAPAEVEGKLYERWVARGYFEADSKSDKQPYTIVIPPPNVTGSLHLGHAFQHTLMDALTRRKRMQGYEALWLPGMDHAGIATQNKVEQQLAEEGKSRQDLGREAFVERVWQWKEEYGGKILGQMRRLGDGVDWTRERFTMDEGLSRAVQTVFKKMYDDGLIYRAERIINWCPRCLTAISDIEVEYQEDDGELVSIRYGEGEDSVVVATTRAETMLGDTAVAVHPDDERYRHLIGKHIKLPLTDRSIPVVADAHVDPEFGTGAVKVTPAHDPNDFAIGQRHELPAAHRHGRARCDHRPRPVPGPGPLRGAFGDRRPRCASRAASPPRSARTRTASGTARAARRPSSRGCRMQWWVKVGPLAQAAGDAVRDGRVKIHPADMSRPVLRLGRQHARLVHLPPAVVGPPHPGLVRAGRRGRLRLGPDEEPPAGEGWHQDPDVLDTWFSSGPVAVLHARLARTDPRPGEVLRHGRAAHRATTSSSSGSPG